MTNISRIRELQQLSDQDRQDSPHLAREQAEWLAPRGRTPQETAQNIERTLLYLRRKRRGHLRIV